MRIILWTAIAATYACGEPGAVLVQTTVTPEGAGSVVVTPEQETYAVGDRVTIAAKPAEGFTFVRYDGSLVSATATTSVTLSHDLDVQATFVGEVVGLSLSVDPPSSGTITVAPTGDVHRGDEVKLTAKPASGYAFVRWSGGVEGEKTSATLVVDEETEVVATFVRTDAPITLQVVNDLPRDGDWAQMNTLVRLRLGDSEFTARDNEAGELLTAGESSCEPTSVAPGRTQAFDVTAFKPDYFVYVQTGAWEYDPFFSSCWDLYFTSIHDCGGDCCTDKSATTQITGHTSGARVVKLSSMLPAKTWEGSPLCE